MELSKLKKVVTKTTNKSICTTTVRERKYKIAVIVEKQGTLMAKVGKFVYPLTLESFSPKGGIRMYSLPANTLFESYTPMTCASTTYTMNTRYSRVKPEMIVKGYIVEGDYHNQEFEIIEYNLLPKSEVYD